MNEINKKKNPQLKSKNTYKNQMHKSSESLF
jgi:hypothetical protein